MSSLFIGLGGVGTGTLECLSKKMDEYNDSLSARGNRPVGAYYYYIDTDETIYWKDASRFDTGTGKTFKLIGSKSPDSLRAGYNSVGIKEYQNWYDAAPKKGNLIQGADSTRQYSRLALRGVYQEVYNELKAIITQVIHPNSRGRIYVVTGSCGGTGCGIYMDILYMIGEIYEELHTSNQETDVRLIMSMPEGYIPASDPRLDVQRHKTLLNAFGTLSELNAISRDKYTVTAENLPNSSFSYCSLNKPEGRGDDDGWSFGPFRFGYLYESANQSRDVISQKIADFIFEIELAGMQVNVLQAGQYCGSAFDIMLTNHIEADWKNSSGEQFTKAFCSMGQFSIEKPDEIWRKYFKKRLLYEAFHKGLIDSEIYKTDTSLIRVEGNKLLSQIEEQIGLIYEEIERSITNESLKNETLGDIVYKVFTPAPDVRNELSNVVLEQKSILLDRVKRITYSQCKEWLKQYDFTTVYRIIDWLDVALYKVACDANSKLGDRIDKAKADSKNLINKWSENNAVKQFKNVLRYWLTYEVNRALTASDKDITIDNKGFLDNCKFFISNAKRLLVMPKENEEWESEFKKVVNELKLKDDRCYLPELNTIIDDNSNIILNSSMVTTYENEIVVNSNKADLQEGTCTPKMLQEEIFKRLSADKNLELCGIILDNLFDPTPGASGSLRLNDKVARFIEEYINKANDIIDELIASNQKVMTLFNTDIVTRLASLDKVQKASICQKFKRYDNVELKTVDIPGDAVSTFKVYISNFGGNTTIMQALDIVSVNGQKMPNCEIIDDAFYSDKIVKLIVKACYSIDQYRYFSDYKKYANLQMSEDQAHDPFIDKRFKGTIKRGVFDMDVYQALHVISANAKILEEKSNKEKEVQEEYNNFNLEGCSENEIYISIAATLYQYFKYLNDHNKIPIAFKDGILLSGTELSLKRFKYQRVTKRYIAEPDVDKIDLKKKYGINDFISLDLWIDTVMAQKNEIADENQLISDAFVFLSDNGIDFSELLSDKVANMQGEGKKPLYDYFRAYQNWLKNINS